MAVKAPETLGEVLYWAYSNLAMAHAAVDEGATKYSRVHFIIRSRLYAGLRNGTMNVGSLADDERVKMVLDKMCCYCGGKKTLSLDHLIPRSRGGSDSGDNLVWSCRSCNSSKGARDLLLWFQSREEFPPLLLLRRYLKVSIEIARTAELLDAGPDDRDAEQLPFAIEGIPSKFPPPHTLRLWVSALPEVRDETS